MKFRKHRTTTPDTKVEIQMTPMLDMIFQLLIFFILTFKPVTDEGQFAVNMSSITGGVNAVPTFVPGMGQADEQMQTEVQFNPPFRIGLRAGPDGHLAQRGIVLGKRPVLSMGQLQAELLGVVGDTPEDFEVVIEADPGLQYQYIIQAVNAISHAGIKKINFGSPQPQPPSG